MFYWRTFSGTIKCTLLYGNELNQQQIALTKSYNFHILKLRMTCKRFMDRKVFKYIVILCFMTIFLYQSINGLLRYLEKNTSYHVVMTVSIIDNIPKIIWTFHRRKKQFCIHPYQFARNMHLTIIIKTFLTTKRRQLTMLWDGFKDIHGISNGWFTSSLNLES